MIVMTYVNNFVSFIGLARKEVMSGGNLSLASVKLFIEIKRGKNKDQDFVIHWRSPLHLIYYPGCTAKNITLF
jgi:hypothetical protein